MFVELFFTIMMIESAIMEWVVILGSKSNPARLLFLRERHNQLFWQVTREDTCLLPGYKSLKKAIVIIRVAKEGEEGDIVIKWESREMEVGELMYQQNAWLKLKQQKFIHNLIISYT